jgi:hypothetical protein
VSAAECKKRFLGHALLYISLKELFHHRRKLRGLDCRNQLTGKALVLIGPAANEDLIAFFAAYLHTHQADVADVVLGAGMMAASDVEIDGLLNSLSTFFRKARVEQRCESNRVGPRVGGGKLTAFVVCAGDRAAQSSACLAFQAYVAERLLRCFKIGCANIWENQVLPYGQA